MFDCDFLKDLRYRKHLTQQQLADKLGVHRSIVIRWENGEVIPNADNIKKLAEIFHIKTDILLNK